jgi:hypothetical protein
MALGLWEMDAYDYESHYDLNSTMWNDMPVYQWGGDVTWNHGEEAYSTLQLTSSPFSYRPFDNGLMSISALTRKDSEDFCYMFSANLVGWERSHFIKMLNAGLLYSFSDFTLGSDLGWRYDKYLFLNETTSTLSLEFDPSEKLNLIVKAGYEKCFYINNLASQLFSVDGRFFTGLAAHYFPLRDSDALRLHAVVAYDNGYNGLSINVGVLYNIAIRIY